MGFFDQNITEAAGVVFENGTLVCMQRATSRYAGVFFGETPFAAPTPLLFMQLSVTALLTACLHKILIPLGESAFISQMLVGIAMGPSFIGKYSLWFIKTLFPPFSIYTNETISLFGCMMYMFLVGVRMDLGMVKRSGKKAMVIGVSTFFMPLTINTFMAIGFRFSGKLNPQQLKSVPFIAAFQSLSAFHVIACLLADLNLLNSELGRLASCSSMISGICSWIWIVISFSAQQSIMAQDSSFIWTVFCVFCLIFMIVFILRPILLWMIRRVPESRTVREGYICSILVMILITSLIGEVIGQHYMFGPIVLGMAVPDGPPLGSALVDKLDTYVSLILLPSYFVFSGSLINNDLVDWSSFWIVETLSLSGFAGKVLGAMLPAMYSNMPPNDALLLGLMMSAQGISDVLILQHSMILNLVDKQSYSHMLVSMVVLTGVISPIIKHLYKPSKRYTSNRKRTIQHAKSDSELRLLACIYNQQTTPSIIELLRVSNPTPKNPICFYVVHLLELTGRAAPLNVFHRPGKKNSFHSNESDRIINAFRTYEEHNMNSVLVNLYTTVSPYRSMHDEVCILASDKRVSMVIIPFHKHWTIQGLEESTGQVRSVNENILRMAPCSVGILVDRNTLTSYKSTMYNIAIVFVGGPDDREALAYAMRMSEHPDVSLTMIRIVEPREELQFHGMGIPSRNPDDRSIHEFKIANVGRMHHVYREESIADSVEMISLLQSFQNSYDLIIVGRRHNSASLLFTGLMDWNEFPELGHVGDMLASSDSNCKVSVLVVQQQMTHGKEEDETLKHFKDNNPVAVVDMQAYSQSKAPADLVTDEDIRLSGVRRDALVADYFYNQVCGMDWG
ncbi:hypothetical protein ACFE04_027395 [Oxalis oulophora]